MVLYVVVWQGIVRHSTVWYVRHSTVWYGSIWHGMVWYCVLWYCIIAMQLCGMIWYDILLVSKKFAAFCDKKQQV